MSRCVIIVCLLALLAPLRLTEKEPSGVFWKMPNQIAVGKHIYKVKYAPNIDKEDLDIPVDDKTDEVHDADDLVDGDVVFFKDCNVPDITSKNHYIRIRTSMSVGEQESTVLHELVHAIAHEKGIELPERQVLKLEEGLYELFKKNDWKINFSSKSSDRE